VAERLCGALDRFDPSSASCERAIEACWPPQGAMRTSTELMNHWKLVLVCTFILTAAAISDVLVPIVTTTVSPPAPARN
jgi:hypothetical protein